MLKDDGTGRYLLSYEVTGVIRRIPIEKRGTSRYGHEWVLGGVLLEVSEDGAEGSAPMYLTTFDPELIETINTLGVGKKVRVGYHINTRERFDGYTVSVIADTMELLTDGENFLLGRKEARP
mgnify:CR=1 FL=1